MADPTTTSTSGADTGGSNAGVVSDLTQGAALTNAIVAAVAAGVQTAMSQIFDGFKSLETTVGSVNARMTSLSEDVDKVSKQMSDQGESDTGFTIRSVGTSNPFTDQFRNAEQRDTVFASMLTNLTNMVRHADTMAANVDQYMAGAWTRSLDHFGALPPIAPRSPTGPGTTAG